MKITNKHNLPVAIERAISNDPYVPSGSDISVTKLISSPHLNLLQQRHADEIEEDISDRIYALIGKSVHYILERGSIGTRDISERKLLVKNDLTQGWLMSGIFDCLTYEGELIDYKLTSVFQTMDAMKNGKHLWEAQLNVLDWLITNSDEKLGIEVKKLSIIVIIRDWVKTQSLTKKQYPKKQIITINMRRWSRIEQDTYIKERITLHKMAIEEGRSSICSPAERWHKDDQYAVMKNGCKKALRLLPSLKEAKQYLVNHKLQENKGCHIIFRKGEDVRCASYCDVNKFCSHWNDVPF